MTVQPQSAQALFMISPASFGFDEQTGRTNTFQHHSSLSHAAVLQRAQAEFRAYVEALRAQDIQVVVYEDAPLPPKPNAVFPNNWLSTWPDGRVYLYPMATPSRRPERNPTALASLASQFRVADLRNLDSYENRQQFLEGTGAIVFDHPHRLAYACLSPRCDETLFTQHVRDLGYQPIAFRAENQGAPIYHTNVMMGIQSTTAVICSHSIVSATERRHVVESLERTGHTVVDITPEQMAQFCGNVLEVRNTTGEAFLVLSAAAHAAFTPQQRRILSRDKTLLPVAIPTIEAIGGGSARCMIAEVFLPHQKRPLSQIMALNTDKDLVI